MPPMIRSEKRLKTAPRAIFWNQWRSRPRKRMASSKLRLKRGAGRVVVMASASFPARGARRGAHQVVRRGLAGDGEAEARVEAAGRVDLEDLEPDGQAVARGGGEEVA